jgi:hypothetical protein
LAKQQVNLLIDEIIAQDDFPRQSPLKRFFDRFAAFYFCPAFKKENRHEILTKAINMHIHNIVAAFPPVCLHRTGQRGTAIQKRKVWKHVWNCRMDQYSG